MTLRKHSALCVAVVSLTLSGCATTTSTIGTVGAIAGVAKTYIELKNAGKRPHGLIPADFEQLRVGMPVSDMRVAVGNPTTTSLTPEGWQCHTYNNVYQGYGRNVKTSYTGTYEVVAVGVSDGARVAGWRGEATTATPCRGL